MPQEPRTSRRRAPLLITIGVVAVLVIAFFVFTGLYADVLWYDQLGYLPVLTTEWIARLVLFLIGFVAMAVPVWASIQLAYRTRPVYAKLNSQLDRYQEVFEPLRRLAMYGIPVVLGVFAGVSASSRCADSRCTASRRCSACSPVSRCRVAGNSLSRG